MAMFLTILFISLLAVAFNAIVFAGIKGGEKKRPEIRPEPMLGLAPSTFFGDADAKPATPRQIPIDMLLSQIERHVRLEQAAAESFLAGPTSESLHSRPASPTLN